MGELQVEMLNSGGVIRGAAAPATFITATVHNVREAPTDPASY